MDVDITQVTALIGNPVRTNILWNLLDGRAYTATELAISADTTAQNISMHLRKLVDAELLSVESQGRHKYYRFARKEVAYAIEGLVNLIPKKEEAKVEQSGVKYCRTCYDHLAGKIGVMVAEGLCESGFIKLNDRAFDTTESGLKFFSEFGIDVDHLKKQRRLFAKACLDWSERKFHLAGSLGAALLERMIELGWMRRVKHSRAMVITSEGQRQLYERLKVVV
ncbi:ArsR/SmtB family transcription factor [Reichenbachiella sp.]|uniref:ArsR/SmtB family transcription factor n=1 Tax=Reichenbachiella sp. TaxID=2184521 RepID=UPI003BAF5946